MNTEAYKNLSLQDMEGEIWKDIQGYEGLYKVSNCGRIKSLERLHPYSKYVLKEIIKIQCIDRIGYLKITFSKNNKMSTKSVHRLVAINFIFNENPEKNIEVNHKDLNKKNNHFSNLEWCDKFYNQKHLYKNGVRRPICFWENKSGNLSPRHKEIEMYSKNNEYIRTFGSMREALRYMNGNSLTALTICCKNNNKTAYGYKWKYVNK